MKLWSRRREVENIPRIRVATQHRRCQLLPKPECSLRLSSSASHGVKSRASWPKVVLYPTLQTLDGLARHTPLFGDSTGRETVAQPVKDRQPFPARQWLAVGGLGRKFTQSFQFFRYWRFSMNRWLVPFWGFFEYSLSIP